MGDMAEAFSRKRKEEWECSDCGGAGYNFENPDDPTSLIIDCETCGGDGIKPGHPLKEEGV